MPSDPRLKIKLQIMCGNEIAMGPGKADLLEAIGEHGSISAAGRALGMSYRRTWLLVDVMNRCWASPLVEAAAGGSHGGGARLSDLGQSVLRHFRALQAGAGILESDPEWIAARDSLRQSPLAEQAKG